MEKSKALGDGMTGIANHAKHSEHDEFGEAVKGVSEAICGLVEAAAQASYLGMYCYRLQSQGQKDFSSRDKKLSTLRTEIFPS